MPMEHGSEKRIHQSAQDTRERSYDRMRESGIPQNVARDIAERAARETHEKLERRG